ncbi:MAG TPA: hypothetical protein VIM33_10915 [Gaiellaceae bacterium]
MGADAARAAVDLQVAERLLEEEAVDVDDHDLRRHYVNGAAIVDDFETGDRKIPAGDDPAPAGNWAVIRGTRTLPRPSPPPHRPF